jgi:serine/threonine-protein kinase
MNDAASARPLGDELLDRFEDAWERGPTPKLEDYWRQVRSRITSDAERRRILTELIKIDLHRCWQQPKGGKPLLEAYASRFLDLGGVPQLPPDLIAEEYCARRCAGEHPPHDEYCRRFPTQAPALRQRLSRVDAEMKPPAPTLTDSAAATPLDSVPALFQCLAGLPLLTAEQQKEAAQPEFRGRFRRPADLLEFLRENHWLTAYQIEQLALGRTHTLTVGPYVLLDRLGDGATSVVFKARHRHLQRIVALKLIRKELVRDVAPEVLDRVYQEFRAAGRVSHPHVVHAFDAGPVGSTLFIAMEYVAGMNLLELVRQKGPLPHAQACDYVRQACLALHHAASNGIVHRDVKPSNLIVSAAGNQHPWGLIKLLDLGLARIHHLGQAHSSGMLTQKGAVMGTADYMAPEQALDAHGVDVRADLYSLGCTLFYLLTGRPPFVGGTFVQKIERHRVENPPPVEQLCRGLPAEVAGIVRRLLAKKPNDRFASPEELFLALGGNPAALPASPTLTGEETVSTETDHPATTAVVSQPAITSRRWLLVAFGSMATLFLLAVLGLGIFVGNRPRPTETEDSNRESIRPTVEREVLTPVLALDCGRRQGEVRLQSPQYSYTILAGKPWDNWRVEPPKKSYCWFGNNLLHFEVRVPPRTAGVLRLTFFDGDSNQRAQRLTVQGRERGEFRDFFLAEKVIDVPLTADDTRAGRIDVKIERLGTANAVVSAVEFLERRITSH